MSGLIIFTDLDGTFLDHHDYSFTAALPAYNRCRERGIPVVFTSSKTRAEIEDLRKQTGGADPFISENGGGVFFPADVPVPGTVTSEPIDEYCAVILGRKAVDLVALISSLDYRGRITPFFDMTVTDVMIATDLPEESAERARRRDFSMPFILNDPYFLDTLERAASANDCAITKGGRFYHLVGKRQDKGVAMDVVRSVYAALWNTTPKTVALGDAANDASMLNHADDPVLVMKHDGTHAGLDLPPHTIRTDKPGPAGWNDAVNEILDRF